jgi:hypothetical protein
MVSLIYTQDTTVVGLIHFQLPYITLKLFIVGGDKTVVRK